MTKTEHLANWVAEKHQHQVIKGTKLPYFDHVNKVALMAKNVVEWGYEIGLCHDLLEDTNTSSNELKESLTNFGYPAEAADFITAQVIALTDVFTKTAYPGLSKKERKNLENKRLETIITTAQTVKYADLMDNAAWMMEHDLKHAERYLKKKTVLLQRLNRGDEGLRQQAIIAMQKGLLAF